jgi:hypothetical protein
VESELAISVLVAIAQQQQIAHFLRKKTVNVVLYTRKLRYFVQFFDFVPKIYDENDRCIAPSELKELCFETAGCRGAALATLNSSLFFAFFTIFSDVRNVNRREIEFFPVSLDKISTHLSLKLTQLSQALMDDYEAKSSYITNNYKAYGTLKIQTFQPRESKSIIDEIDKVLAEHYGFTDEELDYIINYDIKYRMGKDLQEDEE